MLKFDSDVFFLSQTIIGSKIIIHYKYPFPRPANYAHEHLTGESFSQWQTENFQPLY